MTLRTFSFICFILAAAPAYSYATIVVMGDSLSAAYRLPKTAGWVSLLDQRLQKTDNDIDVINVSVSGETTAGGVTRIAHILQNYSPELLILELGANDGLRGLPPSLMYNNLATIIQKSLNHGSDVLLVPMKLPPNYGHAYVSEFESVFQKLASRYPVTLGVFLLEGFAGDTQFLQADGLHPNASAQPMILENLWPQIRLLLPQLKR